MNRNDAHQWRLFKFGAVFRWLGSLLSVLILGALPGVGFNVAFATERLIPTETFLIETPDGAHEVLSRWARPGAPMVLLEPGLGARERSLEMMAQLLCARGYDVFVGNWRGAVPHKGPAFPAVERRDLGRDHNGLQEVVLVDFPSHLRFLIHEIATPEQLAYGISVLGHSMGGMMIAGTLSQPALAQEFSPYLRAAVLYQSPHKLNRLSKPLKGLASVAHGVLERLLSRGVGRLDFHTRFLRWGQRQVSQGRWWDRHVIIPGFEALAEWGTRLFLNPVSVDSYALRRHLFRMHAEAVPMELLLDFARAVQRGGEVKTREGRPLIVPQHMSSIPIQLVRTRLDNLAVWEEQGEYFEALSTPWKQRVDIDQMAHIDALFLQGENAPLVDVVDEFLKDPKKKLRPKMIQFPQICEVNLHAG